MKHLLLHMYVYLLAFFKKLFLRSNLTIKILYAPGFNKLRNFNALAKAYVEFVKAKQKVPAYQAFLRSHDFVMPTFSGLVPNIHEIPVSSKENYVNPYLLQERCINGKIPDKGVVIDESSGSSGTATNWVRGKQERETNARMIKFGLQNLFGEGPHFIINAFALGAWATGLNITMSCVRFAKIKSVGPDILKITNTILQFGTGHEYIIMGYPPFLKSLVDGAKIDWHAHQISFILGGEPMTEEMRDYLFAKGIKRIYSSLGASDLELNIAAENDFTISLRRLLRSNAKLRHRVLKYDGALPMVFQYNPADFLIETNEMGELIFTVCRPGYIAPKIRYNLHDKGHILQFETLQGILKELNIDDALLVKSQSDVPLLFHYGRADMTISFFGSNISPIDIQETICRFPQLLSVVNSFSLSTVENKHGQKELTIAFEKQSQSMDLIRNIHELEELFFEELANINQDFREAKRMLISNAQTRIIFYAFGTGPFENSNLHIKAKYLAKN